MLEKYTQEGGLSSLLNRHRLRRTGQLVPSLVRAPPAARCDAPYPWRMDWSGHDPATPLMEMQINFHETGWAIMIFVATTVILSMRKF
jgi:hypothetical protein